MSRLRLTRFREKDSSCGIARLNFNESSADDGSSVSNAGGLWFVGDALGVLHKSSAAVSAGDAVSSSAFSQSVKLVSHGELYEEAIFAVACAPGAGSEVAIGHGNEVSRRQISIRDGAADVDLGQAFRGTHNITHLQYDSSGKHL
jgi:hypothetical protein